jgi:hypothetical protein
MTAKKSGANCGRRGVTEEIRGIDVASQVEKRRSLGIYYTPSRIAEILVRWALIFYASSRMHRALCGS